MQLYNLLCLFYFIFLIFHRKCFACDRSVLSMATNPHTKTVVAQFDDGTIWRVDPEAGLREWFEGTGLSLSFPQLCSLIELGSFGGEEVVVGLTDRHRLFFNDREVCVFSLWSLV